MMKHFALIFTILFIACGRPKQTGSQNHPDTPVPAIQTDTPSNPITLIRTAVEHINSISLQKKHFEFMCDEKMMVDYFYENGKIVKISVDFGTVGDVYAREDYYYDNGRLIFKYEFVEGGPACEGCIKTNEYRSYIRNDNVIRYLKNKSAAKCRRCEFAASSKEYKLLQAKTTEQMKKILCF